AVGPDLRRDHPAPRAERDPSCGRQRVHGRGGRSGRLGGAARVRAVIFDLWDTLVEWPVGEAVRMRERMAAIGGVGEDEFLRRWAATYRPSQTGPLADAYLALGIPSEQVDAEVAERHEFARRVLRPRPGTTGVLRNLRGRGVKLAVLSVCSEEVP